MKIFTNLTLCLSITLMLMNKLDGQQFLKGWSKTPSGIPTTKIIFLPEGINFSPLRSNISEPRIGIFKFLDAGEMKVDIGNTIDIFGFQIPDHGIKLSAGIDFFAYAFTTGAQGLRLQIDAIDGFFGGNLSFSKEAE